jgi:putrescine---pyruvate transaminase
MVRGIRDSIVMCPPLIITHAQIDQMIDTIGKSLDQAWPKLKAI